METSGLPQFTTVEQLPPIHIPVFRRFIDVIIAPHDAFAGISDEKNKSIIWFVPMVIMIFSFSIEVTLMVSSPEMHKRLLMKISPNLQQRVHNGSMTQAQAEKRQAATITILPIGVIFVIILGVPTLGLAITGMFYLFLKHILNGSLQFIDLFAVLSLSNAVNIIGFIVGGIIIYFTGSVS